MNLPETLKTRVQRIEHCIQTKAENFYQAIPSDRLKDAIFYALFSGGKRIRPLITWLCAEQCVNKTLDFEVVLPAALAVEWVHTYSLIHDDLPSMDNDDFRRGQKTLHRAFDESTAILAGDALLSDAFCLLSESSLFSREMSQVFSRAIGSFGMVSGQMMDLSADSIICKSELDAYKTGKLFEASCTLGAMSVSSSNETVEGMKIFGKYFGLLFQKRDDELDCEESLNNAILKDDVPNLSLELEGLVNYCMRRQR